MVDMNTIHGEKQEGSNGKSAAHNKLPANKKRISYDIEPMRERKDEEENNCDNHDANLEEPNLDSGYAWFILCIMFLISSTTSGTSRVYGLVYARQIASGYYDHEQASWPIATASTIENLAGILTPALAQFLSWRQIQLLSTTLFIISNLGAYFSDSLVIDILCLGLVQGLALSTGTVLTLAINNDYFERYRTTAYGISMSGATCGVFLLCPLVERILELNPNNFRPVYLAVAAVLMLNLIFSLFIIPRSSTKAFIARQALLISKQSSGAQFKLDYNRVSRLRQASKLSLEQTHKGPEISTSRVHGGAIGRKISLFESHFERKNSLASVNVDTKIRRISAIARNCSNSSINSKSARKISSISGSGGCYCSCENAYGEKTPAIAKNHSSCSLPKGGGGAGAGGCQMGGSSDGEIIRRQDSVHKYILNKINRYGEKINTCLTRSGSSNSATSRVHNDEMRNGNQKMVKKTFIENKDFSSFENKTKTFYKTREKNSFDFDFDSDLQSHSHLYHKSKVNKQDRDKKYSVGNQSLNLQKSHPSIDLESKNFSFDDKTQLQVGVLNERKSVDTRGRGKEFKNQTKTCEPSGQEGHRVSCVSQFSGIFMTTIEPNNCQLKFSPTLNEQSTNKLTNNKFSNVSYNDNKKDLNLKRTNLNCEDCGEEEEETGLIESLKLLSSPYIHCVWIMLTIYYLISRIFIIILADFGEDHGLSNVESYQLLNYWSVGELVGRVLLASLIDLRWLSVKSCIIFTCFLLSSSIGLMVSIESYYIYSICSILIAAFASLEYMLINALMVEYLGKDKAIACYSIAALISSILLFGRPTLIGLFRDLHGSYDGLLLLLAIICLTFTILFTLFEPLFVRFWPKPMKTT